jgi:3-hydroxyisobutyrate dehydrogenase-like beta-hydroxyacid dehydrogenase
MKVNHLTEPWTENLGLCVELKAEGHVVAVQCPVDQDALFTILHESVHVWQMMMAYMQEDNPGNETEAYTVEHIAKELMLQYQKATGEQLAVSTQRKTRLQAGKRKVQLPSGRSEEASGQECSTPGNDESGVSS